MKIHLTDLLLIFDELHPSTNEEKGLYTFVSRRPDDIMLQLITNVPEGQACLKLYCSSAETPIACYEFRRCTEIRVLDPTRRCFEIVSKAAEGRCFVSLIENVICDYTCGHDLHRDLFEGSLSSNPEDFSLGRD